MKKLLISLIISLLVLGAASCKKNPVEVSEEEPENLTPGRRDYTWTVDTIKNYTLHLYSIWGKAPNDVFVVGFGSGDQVWRYNGEKWYPEKRVFIFGPIGVYGYNEKVWICTDWGQIWKFSEGKYSKELDIRIDPDYPFNFYSLDGSSDNEIFATGLNSPEKNKDAIIFKYNGNTWSLFKVFANAGVINILKYGSINNKYYCNSILNDGTGKKIERVYEFDRENLKLLNEHTITPEMLSTINTIQGYIYIALGRKIYCYTEGAMELKFEITNPEFGGQLWGRSRKDILIRMHDGIAHYNGADIQYLLKFPHDNRLAPNAMIFDKEVFIPAKDYATGYSIIYHGVLK